MTWKIIAGGRRREDGWVGIDLEAGRVAFQAQADFTLATPLEHLTKDRRLRTIGIMIWQRDWRRVYVLQHRAAWTAADYFIHVARLFGERGIAEP